MTSISTRIYIVIFPLFDTSNSHKGIIAIFDNYELAVDFCNKRGFSKENITGMPINSYISLTTGAITKI